MPTGKQILTPYCNLDEVKERYPDAAWAQEHYQYWEWTLDELREYEQMIPPAVTSTLWHRFDDRLKMGLTNEYISSTARNISSEFRMATTTAITQLTSEQIDQHVINEVKGLGPHASICLQLYSWHAMVTNAFARPEELVTEYGLRRDQAKALREWIASWMDPEFMVYLSREYA